MLSRRLLRVKVVKALFGHLKSDSTNMIASEKTLLASIDKTYDLYFQLMELIVAKNRHGNTGTRRMAWDGAQGRVTGLATTEPTGGRNPYAWTDGAPDKPEQMKL